MLQSALLQFSGSVSRVITVLITGTHNQHAGWCVHVLSRVRVCSHLALRPVQLRKACYILMLWAYPTSTLKAERHQLNSHRY
jgi:hypothetical protein